MITYLVTNISEKLMILLEFHFESAKKICTCISKPDLDLNWNTVVMIASMFDVMLPCPEDRLIKQLTFCHKNLFSLWYYHDIVRKGSS